MLRPIALLTIPAFAALSLSACTTTSNTQKCGGGKCEIDLSGKGSSVIMGGEGGSELELVSASGNTATVKIAGKQGTLTVGQPVPISNANLILEEVEGEDDVQILLDTRQFDKGGATTPDGGAAPTTSPN